MAAFGRGLLVLLLVALALRLAPAGPPLPPNPHEAMNAPGTCKGCHAYDGSTLAAHEFDVRIPEKCRVCHTEEQLGRSHPIGVDPRHSAENVDVPEDLPLENGMVSCGTCHNPHLVFLSKTRAYPAQQPAFLEVTGQVEIPWYKTLFLRKSDPDRGFEPLCLACHKDH